MIDFARLLTAIDTFRSKRILCLGDVMLDKYVYGAVERISPEAPIPILSIVSESSTLGGAGNVVMNMAALGANIEFYSAVGNDRAGIEIKGLLEKARGIVPYISTHGSSTVKTRYISGNQQVLRVDIDGVSKINYVDSDDICACDALVISDYDKGIAGEIAAKFIAKAKARDIPVVVDSKSLDPVIFRGATFYTPNLSELAKVTHRSVKTGDEIKNAALYLLRQYQFKNILVTRSGSGMTLQTYDNATHIPATAKEVYDVVGAGDTVAAVLTLGLACGLSPHEASYLANIAAGIVVGKRGTSVVEPMELKTEVLKLMDYDKNHLIVE